MNSARGMPDVSISKQTQDKINDEEKVNEKKPNSEIFKNPNLEMKVIDEKPESIKEEKKDDVLETKKPKKKLTEKQLEALARGRQKSIETRKNKKEEKNSAKAQAEQKGTLAPKFEYLEPAPMPPPTQRMPTQFRQNEIDYDKIINGVANVYEERLSKKKQAELEAEQKAQAVEEQVGEFEEKIREDERRRVKEHYDEQKRIKKKDLAQAVSHNVLSRPQQQTQDNPYSYAFAMNSRNKFQRY